MQRLSRLHLDAALVFLTACVALYYRVPSAKRLAFEARNPRIAALMGFLAGALPFLPVLAASAKALITGQPVSVPLPNEQPSSEPSRESMVPSDNP